MIIKLFGIILIHPDESKAHARNASGREDAMTIHGMTIDDPDSLDAAADLVWLRESYGDYCARMADELAEESGVDPDDDTHEDAWSTYNPDRNDGLCLLVTV